jgi:2-oxoglutarate ferredoxin oxidoreductase subunit gamma
MREEIIISGFGGQGILFAGKLLAHAGLESGLNVVFFPSYGPEMRGGTAHCTVIISEDEIGSPFIRNPSVAIVMNIPSFERYEPLVKEGGLLVVNTSLVDRSPSRGDIEVIPIPANDIAEEVGDKRLANIVLIGALLERSDIITLDVVQKSLQKNIPEYRRNLLEANLAALTRGTQFVADKDLVKT